MWWGYFHRKQHDLYKSHTCVAECCKWFHISQFTCLTLLQVIENIAPTCRQTWQKSSNIEHLSIHPSVTKRCTSSEKSANTDEKRLGNKATDKPSQQANQPISGPRVHYTPTHHPSFKVAWARRGHEER